MSPLLKKAEKAGIKALRLKRNPVNITPSDFFSGGELLRAEYGKLLNISDNKRIAIIPSVSYGIASVAANVKLSKGDELIVAGDQFPSNYFTWERLCNETSATLKIVKAPDDLNERGKKWNEKILDAITKNTKVVALAHTHWTDGTKFDLEKIRKRTRDVGALLIIDGTQSVGALPFDFEKFQPDALICAGYKWLLGPYSIGLAYFGEYFDSGKPIEESWMNRLNAEDFSALVNYQANYQPAALRYDVGEHSNFTLVPMMTKALEQLNNWKPENVQAYCKSITVKAVENLKNKGFWVEDEGYRGHHLIGLRLPAGMDLEKIKAALLKNKIYVSYRANALRLAPNVYNDEADLNKFVRVVTQRHV
jgi:selenocysteine lyase/cysteine desulfurase